MDEALRAFLASIEDPGRPRQSLGRKTTKGGGGPVRDAGVVCGVGWCGGVESREPIHRGHNSVIAMLFPTCHAPEVNNIVKEMLYPMTP